MIKAIIFDLDDTLYPEVSYVQSGFLAVAEYISNKYDISRDEIFSFLNTDFNTLGRGSNFNRLVQEFKLPCEVNELIEVYRIHTPTIEIPERICSLLAQLSAKYDLFLLTNGWEEVQRKKVAALGISDYFTQIYYSQSKGLEFRKPHPYFFKKLLFENNLEPQDCLMVGDDLSADIQGAELIGMATFHVRSLLSEEEITLLLQNIETL